MADAIAFHGDPAIKARAQAQLRRHVEAGNFVYFPAWEDGKANAIGAVVEADDTAAYATRLGYPIALVETLPMIINGFRPLPEAARFAEAWLARTPVGGDLSAVVSRMILDLLAKPRLCEIARRYPVMEECRLAIIDLHCRVVEGDEPDRKQWKAARLAAVAATDALGDDVLDRAAGSTVESAAWPGTMRTVLRDTLNATGALNLRVTLAEIGWTPEEESRVFQIRDQAEKDAYKAEFEGLARVHAILDADHPELAERFRQRCDRLDKANETYVAAGWTAIEMIEAAPVVAAQAVEA